MRALLGAASHFCKAVFCEVVVFELRTTVHGARSCTLISRFPVLGVEFEPCALCFGLWALGFGFWALDFGLWTLDFGLWALGFGLWALGFGLWASGSGLWVLGSGLHGSSWKVAAFGFGPQSMGV